LGRSEGPAAPSLASQNGRVTNDDLRMVCSVAHLQPQVPGPDGADGAQAGGRGAQGGAQDGRHGGPQGTGSMSTHAYRDDPRNKDVFIGVRDGVTGRFEQVRCRHAAWGACGAPDAK